MFSVLLALGLFTGILCGPLPNPSTETLPNEQFASAGPIANIPQEINLPIEKNSEPTDEEKLQAQETFYPIGGVWWGVRPWGGWGGWGGYRPWYRPHWGGWGGYRPWYRPHWGGQWGGHWGGHWGGGNWGRVSS